MKLTAKGFTPGTKMTKHQLTQERAILDAHFQKIEREIRLRKYLEQQKDENYIDRDFWRNA